MPCRAADGDDRPPQVTLGWSLAPACSWLQLACRDATLQRERGARWVSVRSKTPGWNRNCTLGGIRTSATKVSGVSVTVDEEEGRAVERPNDTMWRRRHGDGEKKDKKTREVRANLLHRQPGLSTSQAADDDNACVSVYGRWGVGGQLCITPPPPPLSLYPLRWPWWDTAFHLLIAVIGVCEGEVHVFGPPSASVRELENGILWRAASSSKMTHFHYSPGNRTDFCLLRPPAYILIHNSENNL